MSSRFFATFPRQLNVTPCTADEGAAQRATRYASHSCQVGRKLVGQPAPPQSDTSPFRRHPLNGPAQAILADEPDIVEVAHVAGDDAAAMKCDDEVVVVFVSGGEAGGGG